MTDIVPVGSQVTKTLKFRKPYPQFSQAPAWEIVDPNGMVILTGSSLISQTDSNGWDVTFTIPTTYQANSSNDELYLELYGYDVNNQMRSTEITFNLMDAADDFLPTNVLAFDNEDIDDSLILDTDDLGDYIKVSINDYLGVSLCKNVAVQEVTVKRVANRTDVPDRFTEHEYRGYRYDFKIPGIQFPKLTRSAYQLRYDIKSSTFKATEFHSCFRLNSRFIDYIQKLRQYLDKARLIEIDPTLQFMQDELCNSLIEGINYINGHNAVYTFWTVDDIPLPMSSYVVMAAAFHALNTRYLAEGFNAFEFQGLSTSLNFDRKETITYKIEELKAYLDTNLTTAKANAIATFGKGTPDASVTSTQKEARSLVAIQPSLVTNRYSAGFNNDARRIYK